MRRKNKTFKFRGSVNPFTYAKQHLGLTDDDFRDRIARLFGKAQRLAELEARGFTYQKVYVKATTVKAHRRKAHWVMRPMRPRK